MVRASAPREAQAEFVANLLESHQTAGENIVQICDCNAFEFSDGYVDVLGALRGSPVSPDQVVVASPDLVDPNFTDLVTTATPDQQYSYVEKGNAQVLDHVLVNSSMLTRLTRFATARNDADFPEVFRNDPNRPERISDHDMPVAYFSLPEPTPPPVLSLPSTITAEATSPAGAAVTFSATATDSIDGTDPVICTPASGATFALGSTTVNCSATNSHNKTATGSFLVNVVDTTAPVIQCASPDAAWHGTDVSLSCTATDSASGLQNSADASFILSTSVPAGTETPNASTGSHQVCDVAGNCVTAGPITGIKVDKKPPVLTATATVNGLPFISGGWTNQNVMVTFNCTDGGSGVASVTSPITFTAEGANQTANGNCSDQVGNSSTASFPGINIDLTPPNPPLASAAPAANSAGWNNTSVTVSFASNGDAGPVQSGVVNCTQPTLVSTETPGSNISGVCRDLAGNISAPGAITVRIDKTAPTVSVLGVTDGAIYTVGAVPAASCSTSDSLSGVAIPATLTVTGGNAALVGNFTATCAGGADRAGNVAPPVVVHYSVQYNYVRLLPDGDNDLDDQFRAGQIIPVLWELRTADGTFVRRLSAIRSVQFAPNASCAVGGEGTPQNANSAGNTSVILDVLIYQFNWQTRGLAPGCYSFLVGLDDESVRSTIVHLR